MTIDASYELQVDYRAAFFSISVLPVLILILIVSLFLIARFGGTERQAQANSGTFGRAYHDHRLTILSLGLAAVLTVLVTIVYLSSAQNLPYATAARFAFENPNVDAAMPDLITVKLAWCTPHYLGWSSSLACEFNATGLKHTGVFDVHVTYESGKWTVTRATFRRRDGTSMKIR